MVRTMTRYMAVISYDGTNYVGWQRQKNGVSIQEILENAMKETFGTDVDCTASGRTDAGVHAEGQVIHFEVETNIPADKIPFSVNNHLPPDISMLACKIAPKGFNARFSAKRKTYRYSIYYSRFPLPMLEHTCYRSKVPMDVELMKEAATKLVGTHDFKCFMAAGSNIKDKTYRTMYDVTVESKDNIVTITVTGNGFLYNMVRIMAGTLYYVGIGKLTPKDVGRIVAQKDRAQAGKTLPAKGLCLLSVEYDEDEQQPEQQD